MYVVITVRVTVADMIRLEGVTDVVLQHRGMNRQLMRQRQPAGAMLELIIKQGRAFNSENEQLKENSTVQYNTVQVYCLHSKTDFWISGVQNHQDLRLAFLLLTAKR